MNGLLKASIMVACMVCVVFIAGCGGSGESQQLTFQTVEKTSTFLGSSSPIAEGVYVIRANSDWLAFWGNIKAYLLVTPSLPPVDFSKNTVIAVVDANRATGGYSITVTGVQVTAEGVAVEAVQQSPGPFCLVTSAFEQPYHIVTTPVFSGGASLNLDRTVLDCPAP